ncbi:MAG: class I SAM-dependent methyltransferase [Hyphomicrobiales bacterium]|nr:class I SAM-dependent methyltransferase [Hyphomicrobiales bacterium]
MSIAEPSRTAMTATILRAAHQVLDSDDKILHDPLSLGLVPGSSREEILADQRKLQQPVARLARSQAVLRSRFMEDQFAEAVGQGVKGFVNLGAGFDTFAFRQPQWASDVAFVEVDHPSTQASKLEGMARAGLAPPRNLRLCPLDLEEDGSESRLYQFLPVSEPLFFCWLGVCQYLAAAAIEAILKFVLSFPNPTSVCLTINLPERALDGLELRAARLGATAAAEAGEPWRSCFDPEAFCGTLRDMGFSSVVRLAPERAAGRYFAERRDGLHPSRIQQIIYACV